MGKFDNCILACDIDGTLVANGYINPKNIEKIGKNGGGMQKEKRRFGGISAFCPV